MPAAIPNEVFSEVATGLFHTCALSVDRTRLECWGSNALGELGPMALTGSSASPVVVPVGGVSQWDEVGAGAYVSCGRTGGDVYCWGFGGLGQLGNQSTGSSTVPVKVKLDSGAFIHLAVGLFHTCGILADRTLWCWGHNTYGEIGDGSFTDRREPTQVGTDTDWQTVSAGDEHTCATKLDQTLWCWGRDDLGQIGDNTAWTPTLTLVH
jgi:alpha-tubulin suppressor-like RCC1 family protein